MSLPLKEKFGIFTRLNCGFFGIILPLICFSLSYPHSPLHPDWQSGKLKDYLLLLLNGDIGFLFYPFLLYSMVSLTLILISPKKFSSFWMIRLGIYTGVLLALQFFIILNIENFYPNKFSQLVIFLLVSIGIGIAPFGIQRLLIILENRLGRKKTVLLLLFIFAFIYLLITLPFWLKGNPTKFFAPIGGLGLLFLIFAPEFALIVYILISLRLIKLKEIQPTSIPLKSFTTGFWISFFGISWYFAFLKMLEEYGKLSKNQPNCYIATAAANGHPKIVKSYRVMTKNGEEILINSQLQNLKCAEIFLQIIFPRIHRKVRKVYDTIGPFFARFLVHSYLADFTYFLLKPFERMLLRIMKTFIPSIDHLTKDIYNQPHHRK